MMPLRAAGVAERLKHPRQRSSALVAACTSDPAIAGMAVGGRLRLPVVV